MTQDQRDFYQFAPRGPVSPMLDLGELAARLGSIDTFERQGDVIWMDSFEGGFNKWVRNPLGLRAAAGISNEEARTGHVSCKLTSGSDANHLIGIYHYSAYPVLSRMGFEFSFCLHDIIEYLEWILYIDDGTDLRLYGIRWEYATKDLEYHAGAGAWEFIETTGAFVPQSTFFHTVKLVVAADKGQYKSVIFDNVKYPLPAIGPAAAGSIGWPYAMLAITNIGVDGGNDDIFIDDVIFTQNEP